MRKNYYDWLLGEIFKTPAEGLAGYVIFLTEINSRPYLKDIVSNDDPGTDS
jgi:hypothetical protein